MFLKQALNYEKKIQFQYTDFVARKIVDLLYMYSAKQVDCLIAELMSWQCCLFMPIIFYLPGEPQVLISERRLDRFK